MKYKIIKCIFYEKSIIYFCAIMAFFSCENDSFETGTPTELQMAAADALKTNYVELALGRPSSGRADVLWPVYDWTGAIPTNMSIRTSIVNFQTNRLGFSLDACYSTPSFFAILIIHISYKTVSHLQKAKEPAILMNSPFFPDIPKMLNG